MKSKHITNEPALSVNLGTRSYPIVITDSFSGLADWLLEVGCNGPMVVVTNNTIAPLYLADLKAQLSGFKLDIIMLPDGEKHKNFHSLNLIFTQLIENACQRDVTLLALGGGVIGDMTGFAAACYQRGVKFIQIPTTLLAQVDSSVGGKTAINHELGKNMIGAFHQPRLVYINLASLSSLPKRELAAGMAEVIKAAVIADGSFFDWLESNIDKIQALNFDALKHIVSQSCAIKASIVARDETEQGQRALLNFGHTFGHAVELWYGYEQYLHGEAVAIGMVLASGLAREKGLLSDSDCQRLKQLIQQYQLPVGVKEKLDSAKLLKLMLRDKKNRGEGVTLVLPEQIGRCAIFANHDAVQLQLYLQQAL